MNATAPSSLPQLTRHDHERVKNFIESEVGIMLPPDKNSLVESRLRRRVILLGYPSFSAYFDWSLGSYEGRSERVHIIDSITTNKTFFFREVEQFDFLLEHALPSLERERSHHMRDRMHFWSAGCSSGEEPYTLAMLLLNASEQTRGLVFRILATDISHQVLQRAARGIYTAEQSQSVPFAFRQKYLLRSRNPKEALIKISPDVRKLIDFQKMNLMATKFDVPRKMDAIFCRNVMIYFDRPTRERVVHQFSRLLVKGGFLFIGHSETLADLNDHGLQQVGPQIYQKQIGTKGGQ